MLRFRYCEVAGSCGVGQPTLRMKSRQVASVITIPGNKKFVRPKNAPAPRKILGFFADCAAKKWPFGQPVPRAVCEKAAVSVQPSA